MISSTPRTQFHSEVQLCLQLARVRYDGRWFLIYRPEWFNWKGCRLPRLCDVQVQLSQLGGRLRHLPAGFKKAFYSVLQTRMFRYMYIVDSVKHQQLRPAVDCIFMYNRVLFSRNCLQLHLPTHTRVSSTYTFGSSGKQQIKYITNHENESRNPEHESIYSSVRELQDNRFRASERQMMMLIVEWLTYRLTPKALRRAASLTPQGDRRATHVRKMHVTTTRDRISAVKLTSVGSLKYESWYQVRSSFLFSKDIFDTNSPRLLPLRPAKGYSHQRWIRCKSLLHQHPYHNLWLHWPPPCEYRYGISDKVELNRLSCLVHSITRLSDSFGFDSLATMPASIDCHLLLTWACRSSQSKYVQLPKSLSKY